jgi:hypothetical protein
MITAVTCAQKQISTRAVIDNYATYARNAAAVARGGVDMIV